MITRPTTEALILDCCRELTDAILPALTDETLRLRLIMTETVLRNAAVRAAHEIAWMQGETSALMAYAAAVQARHGSAPLRAALAAVEASAPGGLHLADVADRYERAGQAFENGAGGCAGSRSRRSHRAGPGAAARSDRDREAGDGQLRGRRPLNRHGVREQLGGHGVRE